MSSTSQYTFLYILQSSDISHVFRQTENATWCFPSKCHKGLILIITVPLSVVWASFTYLFGYSVCDLWA